MKLQKLMLGVVCGAALVGCGQGLDTTESMYSGRQPPVPVIADEVHGVAIGANGFENANRRAMDDRIIEVMGRTVEIRNNDGMAHQLASTNCPELNLGTINPGQTLTATLPVEWVGCVLHSPGRTGSRWRVFLVSQDARF
jgi:hypothetical protein